MREELSNELAMQVWEIITEAKYDLTDAEFVRFLSVLVGEMINCVEGMR